jgi:hypothetical protein
MSEKEEVRALGTAYDPHFQIWGLTSNQLTGGAFQTIFALAGLPLGKVKRKGYRLVLHQVSGGGVNREYTPASTGTCWRDIMFLWWISLVYF